LQALVDTYARQEGTKIKSWAEYKRRIEPVFANQRRTGSTMLGNVGIEPHIIEAALNRVSVRSQPDAT